MVVSLWPPILYVHMAPWLISSISTLMSDRNSNRIEKISNTTMLSSNGDFSDFQEVVRLLGEKSKEAFLYDDGVRMTPRDYANYLARVSYQKRNKLNPLYLQNVVAVNLSFIYFRDTIMDKPFLVM